MKTYRETLLKGETGNILIVGMFLTLFLVLSILISYHVDVSFANKLTGIVLSNLFVGRVPALSFGYAAQLPHVVVISVNVITELILVCVLYPLFVLSMQGILKVKALEEFFKEVTLKKQKHQEKFDKYGTVGLFVFVFIPFWMTGPIVGAMIGFLIGIKHYTTIVIVSIATTIAITLWGLFLQEIIDFLLKFDSEIAWALLCVFISFVLIFRFKDSIISFWKNKRA